jgi:Uma2 family endonuclease
VATTQTERVSEESYRRLALADPAGQLELYQGELREKPAMGARHGSLMFHVAFLLQYQLDRNEYRLRVNHARLRRSADTYFVPDVVVIPAALELALVENPNSLDAYPEPLPLVVEIWSPSTGRYDIKDKLPDYQARGDQEIWYIHPFERTVTVWRRQSDGMYSESLYRDGMLVPESLPSVAIDIEMLFDL